MVQLPPIVQLPPEEIVAVSVEVLLPRDASSEQETEAVLISGEAAVVAIFAVKVIVDGLPDAIDWLVSH